MATFALTDIEGGAARWARDRAAMQEAMRRHDAILRGAIESRGGRVFKTIGDAFYAIFERTEDAVAALLAAQKSLVAEDFSAVDGLRVRAAIHTGAAEEREGDYFGPAVNKAARLLAIGHGGQILLTSESAEIVAGSLESGVSLRELGAHHLKDFAEPLRSLGTLPSHLSVVDAAEFRSVPTFSGRDEELAALHAALQREDAIAVVHGLGGIGKSSIAREYGWRNRDAYSIAWWLNAQTEEGIIDGLLRLGSMFVHGLDRLADRRDAAQRVINSVLGGLDKPALLVFDNLEDEQLMRRWLPRTGARAL
ncbi:MAG TPA: adenylate/guanylate cyclase domain-containing protein, partial [Candidatus Nitrosotalea sp.]|nr:adenylate/guanylate cyclase domain-containing protein [Candidatus Nitrosotalea sp.]